MITGTLPGKQNSGRRDDPALWAKTVLDMKQKNRISRAAELTAAGYEIRAEARRVQELYLGLYAANGKKGL